MSFWSVQYRHVPFSASMLKYRQRVEPVGCALPIVLWRPLSWYNSFQDLLAVWVLLPTTRQVGCKARQSDKHCLAYLAWPYIGFAWSIMQQAFWSLHFCPVLVSLAVKAEPLSTALKSVARSGWNHLAVCASRGVIQEYSNQTVRSPKERRLPSSLSMFVAGRRVTKHRCFFNECSHAGRWCSFPVNQKPRGTRGWSLFPTQVSEWSMMIHMCKKVHVC